MSDIKSVRQRDLLLYAFVVILTVQTAVMFYLATVKEEYHIDEIYSFILSNSYDSDKLVNAEAITNRWINGGESLKEFVTVQPGERFAYQKAYLNNTTDAHPPMFYFLLHTVCSLFPDTFSKWLGFSLNIVFFLMTQILMFRLSCELFRGVIWKLLPVTAYGFAPIAVDIVIFIRMYSVLAFFTMLLFYIHFRMRRGQLKLPWLSCFAVVFLGVFTQYFFAISAFYLALCFCIRYFRRKEYRELLMYAISMMSGVLLVFLLYPAAVTQTTGSKTNNVGNEVSSNITNFAILPKHAYSYLYQFVNRMTDNWKWLIVYPAVLCLIAVLAVVFRKKAGRSDDNPKSNTLHNINRSELFPAAGIMILTVVTVAHIAGKFTYLRYLYNIMPVGFLILIALVYYVCCQYRLNGSVIAVGLLLLSFFIGADTVISQNCDYLFKERRQANLRTEELIQNRPLIVLSGGKSHLMTGNFTLYYDIDALYISDTDRIRLDELVRDRETPDGVVLQILQQTQWSEGYDCDETVRRLVEESDRFDSIEPLGDALFSSMYLVRSGGAPVV